MALNSRNTGHIFHTFFSFHKNTFSILIDGESITIVEKYDWND